MESFNLDARQLARIEAVHRGFLYQHLYAAACLFRAAQSGVTHVIVENDEDIELVFPEKRIYCQVKTRGSQLIFSDIDDALARFDQIRAEHTAGRRSGACQFVIISNTTPGPDLSKRVSSQTWPADVALMYPGSASLDASLPEPWASIVDGFQACRTAAETLPFAILAPETLVWKLAGRILAASAGIEPKATHTFAVDDFPALFEQLVIQLQDFPAPPLRYRPQDNEPPLFSGQRVRLVIGFSGAGKTSWVSQTALHATDRLAYLRRCRHIRARLGERGRARACRPHVRIARREAWGDPPARRERDRDPRRDRPPPRRGRSHGDRHAGQCAPRSRHRSRASCRRVAAAALPAPRATDRFDCQSAFNWDPRFAFNRDPSLGQGETTALAPA